MISTIGSLKTVYQLISWIAAVLVLYLFYQIGKIIVSKIPEGKKTDIIYEELEHTREVMAVKKDVFAEAKKTAQQTTNSLTSGYVAAISGIGLLLLLSGIFHKSMIAAVGREIYVFTIFVLGVGLFTAIFSLSGFMSRGGDALARYIAMFCKIAPEYRACIKMLMSAKYSDINYRDVLTKIYDGQPNISDTSALLAAGSILNSPVMKSVGAGMEEQINQKENKISLSSEYLGCYEKEENKILYNLTRRVQNFTFIYKIVFCVFCFVLSLAVLH